MLHQTIASEPRLLDGGAAVELQLGGAPYRFHAVWLRDNAQDATTRSPQNGQRLITLQDIPPTTRIAEARWADERIDIRFEPGGDVVGFDAGWLLAHAYDKPAPPAPGWTSAEIERWDGEVAGGQPAPTYAAVSGDDGERLRWLAGLRRHGFARLVEVPTEPSVVFDVAALFGYVRETNYGRRFDVRASVDPDNLADTNLGLQAHTDNPYRDPVPGLQILTCLENGVDGGESVLVDGFKVAERLQAETPSGFNLLARHCARFEYAGSKGVRLRSKRPLVELGVDGELTGVRFNNRSAAAFTDIGYDDMAAYYAAYRAMADLVEDPALALEFKMSPGDLYVVDNQRVLHARRPFSGAGERWLQGCYVDRDGLMSTLAVLAEKETGA